MTNPLLEDILVARAFMMSRGLFDKYPLPTTIALHDWNEGVTIGLMLSPLKPAARLLSSRGIHTVELITTGELVIACDVFNTRPVEIPASRPRKIVKID